MNYDMWQDLWERQPVPSSPPPSETDRLLREIQSDSSREDEDNRRFVRSLLIATAVFCLFSLYSLLTRGFDLRDWLNVLFWGSAGGVGLVFRWRRRALERGFGESLLARIDHAQRVLRESQRYGDWILVVCLLNLSLVIAFFVAELTDARSLLLPLLAGGSVWLFPLVLVWLPGKQRAKLRQRLGELDGMRAQLQAEGEKK